MTFQVARLTEGSAATYACHVTSIQEVTSLPADRLSYLSLYGPEVPCTDLPGSVTTPACTLRSSYVTLTFLRLATLDCIEAAICHC